MQNNTGEKIYYRIVFQTASALSVGSGENRYSDSDFIRNSVGEPFIPGSSLAGIYRSFFDRNEAEYYFGADKKEEDRAESRILVYDAKLQDTKEGIPYRRSVRDCVALDEWKTGKDGHKFDFETVEPGVCFVTYLEQNCGPGDRDIGKELAEIWRERRIYIGRKTMRGLGSVGKATIYRRSFDLTKQPELNTWLDFDMYREEGWTNTEFKENDRQETGQGRMISIDFTLRQKGGISIRRYTTKVTAGAIQPDAEQLTCIAGKDGKEVPYIPGSSWAGTFRHHMERLIPGCTQGCFGDCEKRSSIRFGESFIRDASPKVLTRNAVDRFTGGVIETALFTEKMWYGGTTVLHIELPTDADMGLRRALAASLADLNAGILSVGGLTSVGRGIFEGESLFIDHETVLLGDGMYEQILKKLEEM